MTKLLYFIFIAFGFLLYPQAIIPSSPPISSYRGEKETFKSAYLRNLKKHTRSFQQNHLVLRHAIEFKQVRLNMMPGLNPKQYQKALHLFNISRDNFFFKDAQGQPRRLPWLYPKDGCYDRADAVKNIFTRANIPTKKVFVFGDLRAKSNFAPRAHVSWWYHVAVAFKFKDEVYIVDPALNPHRPTKLKAWIKKQVKSTEDIKISICHRDTLNPGSNCISPIVQDGKQLKTSIRHFLKLEKKNLERLGYNALKELGKFPYWKRKEGLILPKELAHFFKIIESFQ